MVQGFLLFLRPFFIQGPFVFPLFRVSFLSLLKSSEPIVLLLVCLFVYVETLKITIGWLSPWGAIPEKNTKLHQPYFFRGLDHIFSACNLKEKRQGCLFSFSITKKVQTLISNLCTLFFAPQILDPIFFQCPKPTHVFKTRIVGAD